MPPRKKPEVFADGRDKHQSSRFGAADSFSCQSQPPGLCQSQPLTENKNETKLKDPSSSTWASSLQFSPLKAPSPPPAPHAPHTPKFPKLPEWKCFQQVSGSPSEGLRAGEAIDRVCIKDTKVSEEAADRLRSKGICRGKGRVTDDGYMDGYIAGFMDGCAEAQMPKDDLDGLPEAESTVEGGSSTSSCSNSRYAEEPAQVPEELSSYVCHASRPRGTAKELAQEISAASGPGTQAPAQIFYIGDGSPRDGEPTNEEVALGSGDEHVSGGENDIAADVDEIIFRRISEVVAGQDLPSREEEMQVPTADDKETADADQKALPSVGDEVQDQTADAKEPEDPDRDKQLPEVRHDGCLRIIDLMTGEDIASLESSGSETCGALIESLASRFGLESSEIVLVRDNQIVDMSWQVPAGSELGMLRRNLSQIEVCGGDINDGKGWKKLDDNSLYIGSYVHRKKHGAGQWFWPDGSSYVGEFQGDKKAGEGTFTYKDGHWYTGTDAQPNLNRYKFTTP